MALLYTVRGDVVDRSGASTAGLAVELAATPDGEALAQTQTRADGTFVLAYEVELPDPGGGGELAPRPGPVPLPRPFRGLLRVRRGAELVATQPVGPITAGRSVSASVVFGAPAQTTTEVSLHELGQTIAATVARVQDELARYESGLGSFVVDDVEVSIPLRLRVDDLGQVRATVVSEASAGDPGVASLQLRVKPVLGATAPPPVTSQQPLASLGLPAADVDRLAAQRIFSVDDLLAVAARPAGLAGLRQLGVSKLDEALGRAQMVSLPVLPDAVAAAVARAGVDSPAAFVKSDPARLARSLTARLRQPVSADDVKEWQASVHDALTVPVPTKATG